jgi:hypothetical protein
MHCVWPTAHTICTLSGGTMNKTNECLICGRQVESRVKMLGHLKQNHTLEERLNALILKAQPAEDTHV